jgi:uncharacterized protein (DUF169 family)
MTRRERRRRRGRRNKQLLDDQTERKRRRGRRHKQLLDDQKGKRRYLYLEEEALDCTGCELALGIGYGPVASRKGTHKYRQYIASEG